MLPIADLLNHATGAKPLRAHRAKESEWFQFRTHRAVARGEELWINYGSENDMAGLLATYGFTTNAARPRVQYGLKQSLLELMEKGGVDELGTTRKALFERHRRCEP